MPRVSKKTTELSQLSSQEPVELTDAEKAKQERLARLALARQKAHQVLKEKREAEKAEKERLAQLAKENEELKAKVVAPAPEPAKPTTPPEPAEEEVEEEVVVVKKPKAKPAPKKKKKIVYVEESSSDEESETESEEEVVYKPKKKAASKPKSAPVADPVSSMSRQTIREDLKRMQMQMLYDAMWR